MPVVPLVSVPRRYSTACGGADELKAYDFKVSCYVQAGRGRTYAEKVDAGPLELHTCYICKPSRVLEVFRFSKFERERERELILLLKRRALILLLPLLIMHWIAERSRRKALKRKASLRFV